MNNENYRIGFIAQDVYKSITNDKFKNICNKTIRYKDREDEEGEEFMSIDYSRLITVLWATCRNLDSRVSQLEELFIQD